MAEIDLSQKLLGASFVWIIFQLAIILKSNDSSVREHFDSKRI